ncbi:quinoprotein amine dehydrogenase [uncultured Rikenella sp.]|uniref:quinoprotein amine dehydrogenase n=1 Tax=uncultured Rikenella sp. TaxID=368003 RepID=UPI0026051215|nr:quinoprotein amine dehydrogenase [uncultured Rikenella sp.]
MKFNLHHILWIACCGLLSVQCSENSDPVDPDTNSDNYTSYWYYSYEAGTLLNNESMGLEAGKFIPYTAAHRGDTLFVANIAEGSSLILYDLKNNRPFRTLASWTANGKEQKFTSNIDAIVVTDTRLYVNERQSYIHVFDLPDLNYIVSIGNGNWSGPVFQTQAMTVKDGLIFTRDKNGTVSVYKESDAVPENAGKINRYKQAGAGTFGAHNNGFNSQYMESNAEGKLLLTDFEGKRLRVLDPTLVNDEMKNGTVIDLADQTMEELPFKPKTFASTAERMYFTGDNNGINIYDRAAKQWNNPIKSIKGFAFSQAARIHRVTDESFWVSDLTKQAVVKMDVYKNEIREYSRISDRIIRVDAALTSKGMETTPVFVDIRTHEIVDPETIGQ